MSTRRSQLTPFLIIGSLFFYVLLQLYISSGNVKKQVFYSNAQNAGCSETVTGNEAYNGGILYLGTNIAAQNSPDNYKQIRLAYNCANSNDSVAKSSYIPVTVIYDLFFLKGDTTTIANNLAAMKQYGLYPIIRVASYTSNGNWIKLVILPGGTNDRYIMGQHLADALGKVGGFPQTPIVLFGNEPNLDAEWGGDANANEFREAFIDFTKGMNAAGNNNYLIYFPALSYGVTGNNSPANFLAGFFGNNSTFPQKIDGAALNIYGQDFTSVQSQFNSQVAALNSYSNYFNGSLKTVISELGPIRNGQADANCTSEWQQLAKDLTAGYLKNPLTIATMACFGNTTSPAVITYNQQTAQLLTLTGGTQQNTGGGNNAGGGNAEGTTTTTTTNNAVETGANAINFNPQNPAPNTDFSITTTSGTGYTWVYLKIFKQNDNTNPVWVAANNLGDEPSVKNTAPYEWTYHLGKGKPATLPTGDYKVVFYSDCDKGCSERASRTLSIGAGKTNDTQTKPTTQTTQTTKPNIQTTQTTTTQTNQTTTQTQQPPQTVTVNNPPNEKNCQGIDIRPGNNKYNLVILPAGYPSLDSFLSDVKTAVASIDKTNLDINTRNKINIWAYKDTSIDLQAGNHCELGGLCLNQTAAQSYKQACGGDGYIVLYNYQKEENGEAMVCGGEALSTNVVVDGGFRPFPHELGHSIACLNDEYTITNGGREEVRINCSTSSSNNQNIACPGWEHYNGAGCFQGCGLTTQLYKSTEKSSMNHLDDFSWQLNGPSLEGWKVALQNYN